MVGAICLLVISVIVVAGIFGSWLDHRKSLKDGKTESDEDVLREKKIRQEYSEMLKTEKTLAEWCDFSYEECISFWEEPVYDERCFAFVPAPEFLVEEEYTGAVALIIGMPRNLANRIYMSMEEWQRSIVKDDVYGYGKTIDWVTKLYDQAAKYDKDQKFKYIGGNLYPVDEN